MIRFEEMDGADDGGAFVPPLDGVTAIAVTSMDGRATVDGVSGGLGIPSDAALLQAVRRASDLILVGAGTVRAEDYGPAATPTRLAVLSRSLDLDPESRLFSDPTHPPIIIGGAAAAPERRAALAAAGAELIDLGDTGPVPVLDAVRRLGFRRITVEGGPRVYRDFLAADAVDRVFLTLAPMIVGAGSATFGTDVRDVHDNRTTTPLGFHADAAAFSDSHVFVRYSRLRTG